MSNNNDSQHCFVEAYKRLIRNQTRGWFASFLRLGLTPISWCYGGVIAVRNWLYDRKMLRIDRLPPKISVISVGNLTLGGTGKTPFVVYLADYFLEKGVNVGLISRGYKAVEASKNISGKNIFGEESNELPTREKRNDEAKEIALLTPALPHFQAPRRIVAARKLLEAYPQTNLILLDDGFQHRALERNLDIVLLDALTPLSRESLFPRGLLREPIAALRRAGIVLLSRADLISEERRFAIEQRIRQVAPQALFASIAHHPICIMNKEGTISPWEQRFVHKKKIFAFCGLGNPDGFYQMITHYGGKLTGTFSFPDHHHYRVKELKKIEQSAQASDAELILTTMKDMVKINELSYELPNLNAVIIGIEIISGEEELLERLNQFVEGVRD